MLKVAEQVAQEHGYIEIENKPMNAAKDSFWGNVALASISQKPIVIRTVKYILPVFEGELDEKKSRPKIYIDMFWTAPRLNISLPDGTFCCLTYRDNVCSDAQAFGNNGLAFALSIKERLDYLLND